MKLRTLFATLTVSVGLISVAGCSYDDTDILNKVNDLDSRLTKLEEIVNNMNRDIKSLQTIVNALQNNDYVTSVAPVMENGKEIGYTIPSARAILLLSIMERMGPTVKMVIIL